MSLEENKEIVRRWFDEVVSQGDMSVLDAICAACHPQFVVSRGVVNPPPQGIPGIKALIGQLRTAFPDLKANITDQIAEGDMVVSRVTMQGTQKGEIFGIPATGKSFSIEGVSIWEVKGGFLISEWVSWDTMGMMQQLGVMPPPAGQAA